MGACDSGERGRRERAIAFVLRWLAGIVGVRVQKLEVSVAKWPKDAEHNAGDRYLRVYVSVVALGRFIDLEVRV